MRKAFTLVEILMVLVIVAVLAALTYPILMRAREPARQTTCTSNIRQLAMAAALYEEDHGLGPPMLLGDLIPYVKSNELFKCPNDSWGGVREAETVSLGSPVSYVTPFQGDSEKLEMLRAEDSNHGVVACLLHGKLMPNGMREKPWGLYSSFSGLVLRARRDGSVQRSTVPIRCYKEAGSAFVSSRPAWDIFTDVRPCPPEICGTREEIPCPFET